MKIFSLFLSFLIFLSFSAVGFCADENQNNLENSNLNFTQTNEAQSAPQNTAREENKEAKEFTTFKTFVADFTQKVRAQDGGEIIYSGEVLAKAPNLVLWRYINPMPKEVYIKGSEMAIYEPKLLQAIFLKANDYLDIFSITKKARYYGNGNFLVRVINQDYVLRTQGNMLKEIEFTDELGNFSLVQFNNQKVDLNLGDEIFTFIPPEGIDLVYE